MKHVWHSGSNNHPSGPAEVFLQKERIQQLLGTRLWIATHSSSPSLWNGHFFLIHCIPKTTLDESPRGTMAAEADPTLFPCPPPHHLWTQYWWGSRTDRRTAQAAELDKPLQLSCQGHLQLPEHKHPDTSPAAAQAQGPKATTSTGKTGSHQLYVKLLWNCAIRTGTTWKRKLITLLFLIIQRQIDTSSETLARRYLFPFHNKVKTHKDSEKNQNQHNNKNPQTNKNNPTNK